MKALYPYGQHLVNVTGTLTSSGLTATLYAPGVSGLPTDEWTDVYDITITSSDTTVEQVQLTDGTLTLTYQISATEPIDSNAVVPWRFGKGKTIYALAGAVTAAKAINVLVRGISSKT